MGRAAAGLCIALLASCRPTTTGTATEEPEPAAAPEANTDTREPAAEPDAGAGPWGVPPPAQWDSLGDIDPQGWDGRVSTTRSVTLSRRSAVWLHPEGLAWGPEESGPFEPPVTFGKLDDPFGLRIVAEFGGVRLLLYASPEDLSMVVRRDAPLHAGPGVAAPAADGRVELRVGAAVEVLQRRPGWAQVQLRDDPFVLGGWLPDDTIGVEFDAPQPDALPGSERLRLEAPVDIVSFDGRTPVLTLDTSAKHWWVRARGRHGRLTRVRYEPPCNGRWRIEGYVKTRRPAKRRAVPTEPASPCPTTVAVLPFIDDRLPRVRLAGDTVLLERPGGQPIGITLRPVEVIDRGDDTYWLASPWGPVPVAIADAGVAP